MNSLSNMVLAPSYESCGYVVNYLIFFKEHFEDKNRNLKITYT